MPIGLPIRFECDGADGGCPMVIELQQFPGVTHTPCSVTIPIANLPPEWTLAPDGSLFCPQCAPRRVVPVGIMPDLSNLNGRKPR